MADRNRCHHPPLNYPAWWFFSGNAGHENQAMKKLNLYLPRNIGKIILSLPITFWHTMHKCTKIFGIFFRIYITCQMDSYPTFKLLFDGSKVFLPLPTPPGLLFVALPPFPWLFPNEGLLLLNCTPGLKGIEANISGLGISMGPVGLFFGPSPANYVNLSTRNLARK